MSSHLRGFFPTEFSPTTTVVRSLASEYAFDSDDSDPPDFYPLWEEHHPYTVQSDSSGLMNTATFFQERDTSLIETPPKQEDIKHSMLPQLSRAIYSCHKGMIRNIVPYGSSEFATADTQNQATLWDIGFTRKGSFVANKPIIASTTTSTGPVLVLGDQASREMRVLTPTGPIRSYSINPPQNRSFYTRFCATLFEPQSEDGSIHGLFGNRGYIEHFSLSLKSPGVFTYPSLPTFKNQPAFLIIPQDPKSLKAPLIVASGPNIYFLETDSEDGHSFNFITSSITSSEEQIDIVAMDMPKTFSNRIGYFHFAAKGTPNNMQVVDTVYQQIIFTGVGHTGACSALKFFPDSDDLLVSGGSDQTMKVWDIRQKEEPVLEWSHSGPVSALLPIDSNQVVSCSGWNMMNSSMGIWDCRSLREML